MTTIEKIFDTDYIYIPALLCVVAGIIYLLVVSYLDIEVTDFLLYGSAGVGFVLGSIIKVIVLNSKEE